MILCTDFNVVKILGGFAKNGKAVNALLIFSNNQRLYESLLLRQLTASTSSFLLCLRGFPFFLFAEMPLNQWKFFLPRSA